MPAGLNKTVSLNMIMNVSALVVLMSLMACSQVNRNSSESERRQALCRDDIYTVEIAACGTLEEVTVRLDELSAAFPKYKDDLHITTIKTPEGKVIYALRSGVFIRNQEAQNYYEKFVDDTGLADASLIKAE